ncbi:LysR family transcriptional regulator [Sphingopyxis sp. YF1]|uniref:LysR family transcriptional regulator n=1 Tax=Sphingopyxis sp. YF1 TaxID=2482763 RepID=UPI001F61C310|nr:LysR family transcriptional regulator [Sphingopyxis sp. YF1]
MLAPKACRRPGLIRVLEPWCRPFDGFNLYTLSREQIPLKLRVFVDFLVEKRQSLMAKQDI